MKAWTVGLIVPAAFCAEAFADRPFLAFNEDDSHFYVAANMSKAAFRDYIDDVCRGHVTHFFACANAQRAIFDSKTFDSAWKGVENPGEWARCLKGLADESLDPLQMWLECCRDKGVSFWVSMRMNDVHDVKDIDCNSHSSFWKNNPEYWRMASSGIDRTRALDYSVPQVREYNLAFAKELIDRYDLDGIELDWMRSGSHLPGGREREFAHILADFMREVREYADAVGKRRGRRIKTGVRVPTTIEAATSIGEDVISWARLGYVDLIVPCNRYATSDFDIPIDRWMREIREVNPDVLVIPGTDSGVIIDNRNFRSRRMMSLAEYCGWAEALWENGARGLYLFNLYENPRDSETWREVLSSGLGREYVAKSRRCVPKSYRDMAGGLEDYRRIPASLERGCLLNLRIGKPPAAGTVGLFVAFDSENVPPALIDTVTLNGTKSLASEPVPVDDWVGGIWANSSSVANAKRVGSSLVKSSWKLSFPLQSLKPGVNEVGVGRHGTLRVAGCELEIVPHLGR